jgi:hypothetical protein
MRPATYDHPDVTIGHVEGDPGDHLIVIRLSFPLGWPEEPRRSVWRDPHDRRRMHPAGDARREDT